MRSRLIAPAALLLVLAVQIPGSAAVRVSPTPSFSTLRLAEGGGEPMISISPSGRTIIVAGLGSDRERPADFFRSTDYGRTFKRIYPGFSQVGGSDWDMRWLDERTLVAADLSDGVYVHRSTDAGLTWTATSVDQELYDRPWIEHFGRDTVYVVAKGFTGIPYLYTSRNGGRSFGSPPVPIIVYGTGAVPAAAGGTSPTAAEAVVGTLNAYVDHIAVDQRRGDVYVLYGLDGENSIKPGTPLGISNRIYVAHLEDGQMVSYPVHLGSADEGFIAGFNWLTVDSAGTVYALLNGVRKGRYSTYLSYSKDRGKTWSKLADLGKGGAASIYGSIAAGSPGTLSLVYLRGSLEDPSKDQAWYVEMARVAGANTARPSVYRTRPVSKPIHLQDVCFDGIMCGQPGFGDNRALLDFIWNAVAPDGTAYAVVASDGPATGDHAGRTPSILLLRQKGGTKHGRGAPS